ncbi:MutT/nudix family protein [Alteromonas alvinellae]|jgi:8-oxo-dGTP pyrophosphatase MutT (NUDIX family)
MVILFRLSAIFAVLTLFACSKSSPSSPMCRVSEALLSESVHIGSSMAESPVGAACLIKTGNKVLMVEHRLSGKLDFPGGTSDKNESLACTTHRETWEETGFNVEVSAYLFTTSNGLVIFGCDVDAGIERLPDTFDAPSWAKLEVVRLVKVDPFMLDHDALRFADDLIPLRDGYTQFDITQH